MNTQTCPTCGGPATAEDWCEACQKRITPPPVIRYEKRSSSRLPRRWQVKRKYLHWTAALMSLLLPGAGQVYKGRTKAGIAWLVVVVAAYAFVGLPGAVIHLMCVITAGSAARVIRRPFLDTGIGWAKPKT